MHRKTIIHCPILTGSISFSFEQNLSCSAIARRRPSAPTLYFTKSYFLMQLHGLPKIYNISFSWNRRNMYSIALFEKRKRKPSS